MQRTQQQPGTVRTQQPRPQQPPQQQNQYHYQQPQPQRPQQQQQPIRTQQSPPAQQKPQQKVPTDVNTMQYKQPNTSYEGLVCNPVVYPVGYKPEERRYSISSESFNPTQFQNTKFRNIPKSEEDSEAIRSTVTGNVLFKHLDSEQLDIVVAAMMPLELPEGTVVVRQDASEEENDMYVVAAGELDVFYGQTLVATIGPGSAFGEIALMYGCPRTATVKAKTPVKLWVMDRQTFRHILMVEGIRRRELYEGFLQEVPLLSSLLPYERSKVADALEPVTFKAGDVIIKEGDPYTDGSKFYIIEKGEVVCTKSSSDPNSPPCVSSTLGPGGYFGEIVLLSNKPRQATVTTTTDVRCLSIGREHFNQVMGPCEELLKRSMTNYKSYQELIEERSQKEKTSPVVTKKVTADAPKDKDGEELPDNWSELGELLLSTEDKYDISLDRVKGFQSTMNKNAQQISITSSQVQLIFPAVNDIVQAHEWIFKQIARAKKKNIVGLYLQLATNYSLWTHYRSFLSSFESALATLKECKSFQLFNKFLEEGKAVGGGLSLEEVLEHIHARPKALLSVFEHCQKILSEKETPMKEGEKQHLLTNLDNTIQSLKDALEPK
eukprot:TRINITY_DN826_c0_g1_i1.p1 TRINITY_DN826_c0_g1~~TRINITY_DN826_c0_g1_i1.p1  ORF type:complete len:606 (+),score=159.16 TRINITY_DN826_c0_g1_i1:419-2236(+)